MAHECETSKHIRGVHFVPSMKTIQWRQNMCTTILSYWQYFLLVSLHTEQGNIIHIVAGSQ